MTSPTPTLVTELVYGDRYDTSTSEGVPKTRVVLAVVQPSNNPAWVWVCFHDGRTLFERDECLVVRPADEAVAAEHPRHPALNVVLGWARWLARRNLRRYRVYGARQRCGCWTYVIDTAVHQPAR